MKKETLEQKIKRVTAETVELTDYNPDWVQWYIAEKEHIMECLPEGLVLTIEHFGSTSVPGL